uniref:SH3 domain-containing protein n=1 Tax=Plectus sambesii TaxID=2011161 RepID=A0A914UX08_9BILA
MRLSPNGGRRMRRCDGKVDEQQHEPIAKRRGGNSAKSAVDRWDFGLDSLVNEATREKEVLLDEERRRKQQLEVEDQRNRRHGYIPSLSPALQSNPNRFDGLLGEYGVEDAVDRVARSVSPRGTELHGVAKALYSFSSHNARELAFKKGDIIRIRRMIDQNWYEGELLGRVGIVPVNYVEMTAIAQSDKGLQVVDAEQKLEGQARAMFVFEGRSVNELSLRRGESVTLTKRVDSNWFEGRNSAGRVGIFPISYVQVLSEPSQQRSTFVTDTDVDDVGPRSPAQRHAPARPKTPKISAPLFLTGALDGRAQHGASTNDSPPATLGSRCVLRKLASSCPSGAAIVFASRPYQAFSLFDRRSCVGVPSSLAHSSVASAIRSRRARLAGANRL